ncbi:MAG: alpha/beta hydrolase [Bacteroidetes bacterium]|nr:alpha/beta hydrolase [Bacteroidota bacterium]
MPYLFLQDKLIFQGVKLPKEHPFSFPLPYREFFIPTGDGCELNALLFPCGENTKGLILYFHGNAGNLQRWGNYAVDFTSQGYDVLMMDYRGYGKSSGKPSEDVLYADAGVILHWIREKLKYDKLIIYGRSLGTAVASHLAMTANPHLLILETPFDTLKGIIIPFFKPLFNLMPLNYHFPTVEHLTRIHCRKVIFHGTRDGVTPIRSALNLKPLLAGGDEFVVIPDGRHGNLRTFAQYHQKLKELLQ